MVAEWHLVVDGGMRVLSDGVMVAGVESCGWAVVTGDELTTRRGDHVYLTFLECHGKGRASAAKSPRGVELREGTGVRASSGITADGRRSAKTRREWLNCSANWPFLFAPRTRGTGRPRRAVQTGAMAHGNRKREGAIRPPFRGPTTELRRCHWRGRARRLGFWGGFDTPKEPAPPNALPCRARGFSLGLASSSKAAIEKRRRNGLLNGFMSPLGQFSRPCHSPTSSDRLSRAPRRRQRLRGGLRRHGEVVARGGSSLLHPSSLFVPAGCWAMRKPPAVGISHCQRHQVAFGPLPLPWHPENSGRRLWAMMDDRRLARFSSMAARIHGSMMSESFSRRARNAWTPWPLKSGATGGVRSGYC